MVKSSDHKICGPFGQIKEQVINNLLFYLAGSQYLCVEIHLYEMNKPMDESGLKKRLFLIRNGIKLFVFRILFIRR